MAKSKYDKVLTELLTKFYTDSGVDEKVRKIIREVINIEMENLSLDRPHVLREIEGIIDSEAKEQLKK